MAKRFYIMMTLVRCGDTQWEVDERLHGATDLPLSPVGRAAVSAEIARLPPGHLATVYHAADEAATETARMIASVHGSRTKAVDDLADPDLGLLEGLRQQDLAERYPKRHKTWQDDLLAIVPPEGEPISDARDRVFLALAKLLRRSRADEIAVVLHQIGFGLLRCWLADRPGAEIWPILSDGRRVERYALGTAFINRLRETARAEPVEST
ncbi:MAG: histidine phosphatase family protein [Planctomycetes bacterium]|nr:histidine phosphatase family protein [Planctomycetota bacterium]